MLGNMRYRLGWGELKDQYLYICDRPGTNRHLGIWGKNTKNIVTLELPRYSS